MQSNLVVIIFVILILLVFMFALNTRANPIVGPNNVYNTTEHFNGANKDTVNHVIYGSFVPAGPGCLTAQPLTGGLTVLQENSTPSTPRTPSTPSMPSTPNTPNISTTINTPNTPNTSTQTRINTPTSTVTTTVNPYPGVHATSTVITGKPMVDMSTTRNTSVTPSAKVAEHFGNVGYNRHNNVSSGIKPYNCNKNILAPVRYYDAYNIDDYELLQY